MKQASRKMRLLIVVCVLIGAGCNRTVSQPPPSLPPNGQVDSQVVEASAKKIGERLPSQHLPNLVRIGDKVFSGGLPDGEVAFKELADLGVKTIISVDGMKPDVQTARKFNLRYVHLPHGYDGISQQRTKELAKAVRDLDGPIYIHCHHGKHRSPTAASVACVTAGLIPTSQAIHILEAAGTNPNYRGLFEVARNSRPLSKDELDALVVEFEEVQAIPPVAEAMVHMDHAFEGLQKISKAKWNTPVDHPDLDPAHEALLFRELFTELLRSDEVIHQPADFQAWLRDSEEAAQKLHNALTGSKDRERSADWIVTNDSLLKRVSSNCKACHEKYRDIPLGEKAVKP